MVTAHGGHPGYHLKIHNKHRKRIMLTKGIIDKQEIATTNREEYEKLTMDFSCKELCSYLFVRQSDNKLYRRQKEHQHNAFLI